MEKNLQAACKQREVAIGESLSLEQLEPQECYSIKVPFHALTPGKFTIQANFNYNEGKVESLEVRTQVEAKLEAELTLGVALFAYTLTRLSLNFTLSTPD